MIPVHDNITFGFTMDRASLVTSIEGMVGELSAGFVVFQLRSGDEIEKK